MKSCCRKFCCLVFCCKCCNKNAALKNASDLNRLLPETEETKHILEANEIHCFGTYPKDIIKLATYTQERVKKMVCGNSHCLVLLTNGDCLGFGGNEEGQLGLNPSVQGCQELMLPKQTNAIPLEYTFEDIAAGENFSLLLVKTQQQQYLIRFGLNITDKYKGNQEVPQTIHIEHLPDNIGTIKAIYAFGQRMLLLNDTNDIFIGGIDFKSRMIKGYEILYHFNGVIKSIHLGFGHCIILDTTGKVYGIGDNTYGELGKLKANLNTFEEIDFSKPFQRNTIQKISVGARHTLFLLSNGEVYCIGDNSESQCFGFSTRIADPVKVDLDYQEKVIDIFSGYAHNMILMENGDVLSWGDATNDKLGYKEEHYSQSIPKAILSLKYKSPNCICLGYHMSFVSTGAFIFSLLNGPNSNYKGNAHPNVNANSQSNSNRSRSLNSSGIIKDNDSIILQSNSLRNNNTNNDNNNLEAHLLD